MKILITSGGTREPIDGVRFITNFSTGGTGASLAAFFARRGDQVTYVHARGAVLPTLSSVSIETREFVSFSDLNEALMAVLAKEKFDAILHLAAVSDYSVGSIEVGTRKFIPGSPTGLPGKLPSREELVLRLTPNFKIVDRIKSYCKHGNPTLIAFKLTHTPDENERLERIRALSTNGEIDFVVHNDLLDRNAGHPVFTIYRDSTPLTQATSASTLGAELLRAMGRVGRSKEGNS